MVTRRFIHSINTLLKILRVGFVVMIPLISYQMWSSSPPPPQRTTPSITQMAAEYTSPKKHELAWYAPLWQRDLKQPPIPSVAKQLIKREESGPTPTLIATLVEPKGRFAHLRGKTGRLQLKGIDEYVDDFQVRAIEPGRVQLQNGHGVFWVTIPKSKGSH